MKTYKTSEIASIIGIHPNTIRLYEQLELISKPQRLPNGYRVFTDFHIEQCRLVRIAFKIEIVQNGLRKKIANIVRLSAQKNFDEAIVLATEYSNQLEQEYRNAEEAIEIVKQILSGNEPEHTQELKRKEVSKVLGISMDTLRNWEMNGLFTIKRKENGYRVYMDEDIRYLKIIRSLRCANYSLEAILRLMLKLSKDPNIDIQSVLNTPKENEDTISVCDKLLSSLLAAEDTVRIVLSMLKDMKKKFS